MCENIVWDPRGKNPIDNFRKSKIEYREKSEFLPFFATLAISFSDVFHKIKQLTMENPSASFFLW